MEFFTLEQMLLSKYQREDGPEMWGGCGEVGSLWEARNEKKGAQGALWDRRECKGSDGEHEGM